MSQENVSINRVQAWFEAFNDDADAFRDTLHPEVVWFPFEDNHSPSRGIDGAMQIRRHWLDSWSDQEVELEGLVGDGDNVVVTAHITTRGRGSGVEVDTRLHFHFGLRDGKVVHIYEHLNRAEALEAAGLSEQAMSQENVERIRNAFAGTTAGDFSQLPGLIDDSCEFLLPPTFPGTQTTRGPEGFLSVVQEFEEAFEEIRYEPQEFLDQGDLLFVAVRTVGRPKHTGIAIEVM